MSNARSERNHAQANLSKTQQELTTTKAALAAAHSSLAAAKARGTACSTYAAALQKTVTTGGSLLQAIDEFEAAATGSAAKTAAGDRANQLYDQVRREVGSAQALEPACIALSV
jgi:hypothetical protein